MTDILHGVDVSSLTRMQFRLFAMLRTTNEISAYELANRLRSTNKTVINQVRAIRQKLGAHVIITTTDGYRLGNTKE